MRFFRIGLGSLAEAAHVVVSAIQAARPTGAPQPSDDSTPRPGAADLSLVKLQINVGGRGRRALTAAQERPW